MAAENKPVQLRRKASPFKILLVGDRDVGKTTLVKSFIGQTTNDLDDDGLVDIQTTTVDLNGRVVPIAIYDSPAGHDNFNNNKNFYASADVIILCFDVCNKKTLTNVKERWLPELHSANCAKDFQFLLVGLKTDDRERHQIHDNRRGRTQTTVESVDGKEVHKEINSFAYLECTAKTGHGVKNVFNVATLLASTRKEWRKSWFVAFDKWNSSH